MESSTEEERPAGARADLAIRDTRLFDGERVSDGRTVLVSDGRITAVVPAGTPFEATDTVDGQDGTLMPGLIDSHTHTFEATELTAALAYGTTTVLDQFTAPALARRWKAEQERGPVTGRADIFSAGILATADGGHGTQYGMAMPTLDDPAAADAWVADRVAEGSDWVKLVIEDGSSYGLSLPTLDEPRIRAVVTAAHRHGLTAAAHVARLGSARLATGAGADGLVHVWSDATPDRELLDAMAERGMFVVATLNVTESASGQPAGTAVTSDPRLSAYLDPGAIRNLAASFPVRPGTLSSTDSAMASVRALNDAGVQVLAGTDAPNPGTTHGASLHRELELLVQAGLTPLEVLEAATSAPADAFGLDDRGRIRPGLRADLVLVQGDPTRDITATRAIIGIWKVGHRFDRDAYGRRMSAARESAARTAEATVAGRGPISDFDDGTLRSSFGIGWGESTDAIRGGASVVELSVIDVDDGKALRLSGEVREGTPDPWSGALFFPGSQPREPVDLSRSSALAFRARGDGGRYQVLLIYEQGGMAPARETFTAGPTWTEVVIPWSDFDGADGRGVQGIGIFAVSPGPFDFVIDNVELR